MGLLHFKKGDKVLYLDNKAVVVAVNTKQWFYTIRTLKDNRVFTCSPSELASRLREA